MKICIYICRYYDLKNRTLLFAAKQSISMCLQFFWSVIKWTKNKKARQNITSVPIHETSTAIEDEECDISVLKTNYERCRGWQCRYDRFPGIPEDPKEDVVVEISDKQEDSFVQISSTAEDQSPSRSPMG